MNVMLLLRTFIILFFIGFVLPFRAFTQDSIADSIFYRQSLENTVQSYLKAVGNNTRLYNGSEYTMSYHGVTGSPFFASDSFQYGSVDYDGIKYNNVKMAYDLVGDELIIKAYHDLNLRLVTEKVNSFSFSNHEFVRIMPDSSTSKLKTGFYEILYKGTVTVLAKRKKQVESAFKAEDPYKFSEYEYDYVKKGDIYYPVDSKNSLIDVFGDRKDEIKKYVRKNKIKLKKDRGDEIVKTAQYYVQLKK